MGKFIISNNIISSPTVTSRTEDSDYPDDNVNILTELHRKFMAADATMNDWLLKFNFAGAQVATGILLDDVNFNKVKIQGHASDSWGGPSYAGSDLTISQDALTGRYRIYAALTGFNYQYLRVFIPSGTALTSGSVLSVGRIAILSASTALSINPAEYERGVQEFYGENRTPAGLTRSVLSDYLQYWGELTFGARLESEETELLTLSRMSQASPLVLFENRSVTNKAWVCYKSGNYSARFIDSDKIVGQSIRFEEIIN